MASSLHSLVVVVGSLICAIYTCTNVEAETVLSSEATDSNLNPLVHVTETRRDYPGMEQGFPELHAIVSSDSWPELKGIERYLQIVPIMVSRHKDFSFENLVSVRELSNKFTTDSLSRVQIELDLVVHALLARQVATALSSEAVSYAVDVAESALGDLEKDSPFFLLEGCFADNVGECEKCELKLLSSFHSILVNVSGESASILQDGGKVDDSRDLEEMKLIEEISAGSREFLREIVSCADLLETEFANCLTNKPTNRRGSVQDQEIDL
ncbi:MAG: hypothetical protein OXG24_05380 [Gammaproteobacteria bacterium]|nr:hypothetical protein [Gammaproteobacteria bacterium]